MKKTVAIIFLLLGLCMVNAYAAKPEISCSVQVEEDISISGQISECTESYQVTLQVWDDDKLIYINQLPTTDNGNFSFDFGFLDTQNSGTYPFIIGSNSGADPYSGVLVYEADNRIVCETKVTGRKIKITGKVVNAENGNQLSLNVTNGENSIYNDQKVSNNDGTFVFEFEMPDSAESGDYNIVIDSDAEVDIYTETISYVAIPKPEMDVEYTYTVSGQTINLKGCIKNAEGSSQLMLTLGNVEAPVCTAQTNSKSGGGFEFNFTVPETLPSGSYCFLIETDADMKAFSGILEYTALVEQLFAEGNIDVRISGYVPQITGTLSCAKGKILNFNVVNETDNIVIAEDVITIEQDEYDLSYVLPRLISGKEYVVDISCFAGTKQLFSISLEVDTSLFRIYINGDAKISDGIRVDLQAGIDNVPEVEIDTSLTADKWGNVSIPNLLAYMNAHIRMEAYEQKEVTTEHKNIVPEAALEIMTDKENTVYISNSADPAWFYFTPKYNSVYDVELSEGFDAEIYKKNYGQLILIEETEGVYMEYPYEYYVKITPDSDEYGEISLSVIGDAYAKTTGKAFVVVRPLDEVFANVKDFGRMYVNEIPVSGMSFVYPVSWLCEMNDILYFNDGYNLAMYENEAYTIVGENMDVRYIVTDGQKIYFSNWSDSGKIYRGTPYISGEMSFEKVCDDTASWISVNGDYLYYKNALDGNREYRILKNQTDAENGELTE